MARKSEDQRDRRGTDSPDIKTIKGDWLYCVDNRASNYWTRQKLNWETRYCAWPNQSADGRKWSRTGKDKVWPWPGASDARVPLVDKYIREDVAMLMSVWQDMRVLVRPNSPARDAAWANRMTALLRWLIYEEMEETEDEAELLANYMLERGGAALGIWWHREENLTRERIELKPIMEKAYEARVRMSRGEISDALQFQAELPDLIRDPTKEELAGGMLAALAGQENAELLTPARVSRILAGLRSDGEAWFPRRIVVKDRPVMRALALNEDLWTPPEAGSLQTCRQVFVREWLNASALEERARALKWDGGYIDQVLEDGKGKVTQLSNQPSRAAQGAWNAMGVPETDTLYEIVQAYEKLPDADGVPGIYVTVFCPALREDDCASSELLDYAHGQFPFVNFFTERRSTMMDDARGYGEVASTLQAQIKKQWDARVDRADVATLPPSHHPPGEEPDAWGPGVQIPTLQPERFGYFEIPRFDQGSKEVEETVRRFADEYFGRPVDEQNSVEASLLKREMVRKWLRGWKRADLQVLQLSQQYMPDEFYFRVVGGEQGRGIRATREEIQGPFNVTLKFNAQDLDPELVKQKFELMEKALAIDVNGIVDRNEAIQAVFELIDPGYAERLLKPAEAAAMAEVKDEQDTLAKLLLGIEVDVKGNEAFALRKQVLSAMIQKNPVAQAFIRNVPEIAENVDRRFKQLDFNIQQKMVNPEIGRRLGTPPSQQTMNERVEG